MQSNFTKKFERYDLEIHGVRLPSFEIDPEDKKRIGVSEDVKNIEFLKSLCRQGFRDLGLKKGTDEFDKYVKRIKYELEILEELSFVDYILLVWDIINFCKKNEIPTGPGRGSAAGSIVLYLIGVTKVDPVKHGLFFERFVSKVRAKKKVVNKITYLDGELMCDIDLDICYYNRSKVIEYLQSKFEGKTSKILTLSTLSSKILIKDCGKIIGEKTEAEMNDVSSLIPKVYGQVKDLEESYEEVSRFKEWCDENEECYSIALKLRNLIRNKGVHASGMLLSYDLMSKSCPTELSSDKESVSGYDMNWASLFNVKLDLLGLRSVTIVHDVCSNVGITMDDIDVDSDFIYQQLQDLKTPHGLFQLEAHTNYQVCKSVKPRNLEQLSAVLALARPGALQFAEQYSRYVNEDEYEVIHPFFDDILSTTGGVALYQEQLMQMAHKMGFTLDEAEMLRRIVGKKKVSEVRKWKKKIKDKIKEKNHESKIGKILWDVLEDSANYSFNKSHSIAYAALAAMTIYLKFKYPQQFFLSLLKMTRFEPDPISEISKVHQELRFFGIKLLPPHITKSELDFSKQDKDIRFGLLSIKGISDKSIEKLEQFKNKYSSKFQVFQAAKQAKLPIGILSALIQAGAFQGFKQSRSRVVLEAQLWNILTPKEKSIIMPMSEKHDHDLIDIIKKLTKTKNENGTLMIKESRFATIRRDYGPYLKIYLQNKKSESFANWYYERKLLGYTYDVTLKEIFSKKRPELLDLAEVQEAAVGTDNIFIGYVKEFYHGKSKKGNKYMRLLVGDELADETVLMFEHNLKGCEKVNNGLPQKDNVVIINGVKKEDATFANQIGVQDQKVYTKLSELKNLK